MGALAAGLGGWATGLGDDVGGALVGAGDFAFEGVGEGIELALGQAQFFGVVAEEAFGGPLDAAPQIGDAAAGAFLGAIGLGQEALAEHFGGDFEGFGAIVFGGIAEAIVCALGEDAAIDQFFLKLLNGAGFVLAELAQGIVEFARHQRLGRFGLLGQLCGALDDVGEAGLLPAQALEEIVALGGVAERSALRISELIELLLDFGLVAGEIARVAPHRAQVLGELAGALTAEIVASLLDLPLGARAGGEGLGDGALAGGLGGPLHVLAGLVHLAALLGKARLVFGTFHALPQLVGVGEHLLLLVFEPFELAPDFLAFGLGPGFVEGRLKFAQALVEVLLAAGEFLQAVEDLELFAAFGGLRGLGLALGLVAVVGLGEVELIELALHLVFAAARLLIALAAAAAGDLVLALLQPEQGLVSRLLRSQGLRQRVGGFHRFVQATERVLHPLDGRLPEGGCPRVIDRFAGRLGLFERLGLRIAHHRDILGVGVRRAPLIVLPDPVESFTPDCVWNVGAGVAARGRFRGRGASGLVALQLPSGAYDLFLQFGEPG